MNLLRPEGRCIRPYGGMSLRRASRRVLNQIGRIKAKIFEYFTDNIQGEY
jgi:hypothetical protein